MYIPEILVTLLVIFLVTTFVLTWLFIRKEKMREKFFLIEKGIDITNLPVKEKPVTYSLLKIGIILISACLGLLFGLNSRGMVWLILMILFGGIGMIIAHFVDNPKA